MDNVAEEQVATPVQEPTFTEVAPQTMIDIITEANEVFADIGGGVREWFEQALLPLLREKNIYLVTKQ